MTTAALERRQTLEVKAFGDAPTRATPKRSVKVASKGVVTAIVAVTGVEDQVRDIILPGAFAASLAFRRPKVVDDHDWGKKAGRVLHIEEWMPGDPRLPKQTKEGRPWPKEAGALVATMQYNLRATRGAESFEWVRFYAETNEAEFSIGYKVPDGKARKRADGVRLILAVNLFELSHVLFGAASLTMALDVKDAGPTSQVGDSLPEGLYDHIASFPTRHAKNLHAGTAGTATIPSLGKDEESDEFPDDTPKPPVNTSAPWDEDHESKTALGVVLEAKGLSPTDAKSVHTDAALSAQEVKAMSRMKGSFQERTALVEQAARDLFDVTHADPCVCVVATFDTEAVVTVYSAGEEESYVLPYTLGAGGVELGEPQPAELSLVAEPAAADDPDAESEPPTVEEVAVIAPMIAALDQAAALAATEGKAADAIRGHAAALFGTLEGKDAAVEAPAADGSTITRDNLPEGDWGHYRKTQAVEAVRMPGPFTVETREGVVESEDGWLAIDSDGYPYPVAAEEFEAIYAPIDDTGTDAGSADDKPATEPEPEPEPGVTDPAPQADEPTDEPAGEPAGTDDDGPSPEALDAAYATEETTETKGADEDLVADPEPADDAEETVTLDADEHFDFLADLDSDGDDDD